MKQSFISNAKNGNKRWCSIWKPMLLKIDSKQMYKDGFEFFKTENDVWLVDCVPAKYLEKETLL